jgi:hypothetical protein
VAKTYYLVAMLHVALILFSFALCAETVIGQSSLTTVLPPSACASPSCTLILSASPATIQPSPITVSPSDASSSITIRLGEVTISPSTTVLANTGESLTLGKASMIGYNTTATTTYSILPSGTRSLVVEADEVVEGQIYIGDADTCPLKSQSRLRKRQPLIHGCNLEDQRRILNAGIADSVNILTELGAHANLDDLG